MPNRPIAKSVTCAWCGLKVGLTKKGWTQRHRPRPGSEEAHAAKRAFAKIPSSAMLYCSGSWRLPDMKPSKKREVLN